MRDSASFCTISHVYRESLVKSLGRWCSSSSLLHFCWLVDAFAKWWSVSFWSISSEVFGLESAHNPAHTYLVPGNQLYQEASGLCPSICPHNFFLWLCSILLRLNYFFLLNRDIFPRSNYIWVLAVDYYFLLYNQHDSYYLRIQSSLTTDSFSIFERFRFLSWK